MNVIYKYDMIKLNRIISLPIPFYPVAVGLQLDKPVLWLMIPQNVSKENNRDVVFMLLETGVLFDASLVYIGTYQFANGVVQHLFWKFKDNN